MFQNLKNKLWSLSIKSNDDDDADINRVNVDTSDVAKVLVIGETGSGKSTFINYLTNYFSQGTLDNMKIAIPNKHHPHPTERFAYEENDFHDQTISQTNSCHQYLFEHPRQPGKRFLFLDTPGLGDVRGTEQDAKNMDLIIKSVLALGGLSVVIIVVNGTVVRLTSNMQSVITQLWGNLPDVVMQSVIVVVTNAKRHAANIKLEKLQLRGKVHAFYMQNSAFCKAPSTWDLNQRRDLESDWEDSMNELDRLVTTVQSFTVQSVQAFTEMNDIRNAIKVLLHDATCQIQQIQKMQDDIDVYDQAVKQCGVDQIKFKDFTKTIDEQQPPQLVDASYHSTICELCNFVCHDHCRLDETTTKGAQIFQGCWALYGGNGCRSCPGKKDQSKFLHVSPCSYYQKEKSLKSNRSTCLWAHPRDRFHVYIERKCQCQA